MSYLLIISADTNDADYIENSVYIDESEVELVKRFANAVENMPVHKTRWGNQTHNWPVGECLRADMGELPPEELYKDLFTENEFETISKWMPYGEYGTHTINSIRLLKVEKEIEL